MAATVAPARKLYKSPIGLYDFQAIGVAQAYYELDTLAVWSTGIGKTHLAMATSALLFEDDLVDLVLVTCEVNKMGDWLRDMHTFTDLEAVHYKGDKRRRGKLRQAPPQVMIGTYETIRNDAAKPGPTKLHDYRPGPLCEALEGLRVLLVYDEVSRLGNRTSGVFRAQECLVKHLRKARPGDTRTMGLTATPIERDPANVYNEGRIITPWTVGTVQEFTHDHVVAVDFFGNPCKFHNIGPDDWDGVTRTLKRKLSPALKIKSKSDPDVKDQFPKQVEEFEMVSLDSRHLDFYNTVRDAFYEQEWTPAEERRLFVVLRQIAGHPMSLLRSQGELAQAISGQVGEAGLHALGSAKLDYLLHRLDTVCNGQGEKAIVFTFFGQSILPLLHERIRAADLNVVVNHGQMSADRRYESIQALREGDAQVFLSSDAGSRGLNLPEATYVFNYELPLSFANYRQRNDRIHRIDSLAEIVVTESLIAANTIEEAIANMVLRRNEWHDILLGEQVLGDDDGEGAHLTADDRRKLIAFAKKRTVA
jgi:SNF2 family DNA or RNA helicase